jgi:hypothetical protein
MPRVVKPWTLRRWLRHNFAVTLGLVFVTGLLFGWLLRVF